MDIKIEPSLLIQASSSKAKKRERSESDDSDRRKLVAERKKLRRLEEDPETRRQRLAKDAERKARQRANETQEAKKARLKRSAESRKAKLANETPEERHIRLRKRAESRRKSKAVKSEADTAGSTETECLQQTNDIQDCEFIFDFWYKLLKSMRTDVSEEDETDFANKKFVIAYYIWLDSVKKEGGFNDQPRLGVLFNFSKFSCYFWYFHFLNRTS